MAWWDRKPKHDEPNAGDTTTTFDAVELPPDMEQEPKNMNTSEQQKPFVTISPADYAALTNRAETAERERDAALGNPVLSAATAAGIKDADAFADLVSRAKHGDAYAVEVAANLSKQAVRRFGQDKAPAIVKTYSKLPLEDQKDVAATWKSEADGNFGIKGEDSNGTEKGGERSTAPPSSRNAEDLSGNGGSGKAWDNLTDEEKAHGLRMGSDTDERKESFAKNVIGQRGSK